MRTCVRQGGSPLTEPPSIDDWIEQRAVRPLPQRIAERPDLVEAVEKGRSAGLSWVSLTEWLTLHGFKMSPETLRRMFTGLARDV